MKQGKLYHTHPFGFRFSAAAVQGGAVIAAGFLAGIVNGLLGTGGGIILLLILRQCSGKDRKNAFAASLFCILPLSVLSLLLYIGNGSVRAGDVFVRHHIPMAAGALIGGAAGAYLLDLLKLPFVEKLFALLLIFAGARMVFG